MDIKEIVNRSINRAIDQDEALFVIKSYLKARKGVDTDVYIETRKGNVNTMVEVTKMIRMLPYAIGWFKSEWSK